jgi:cell division FtsZ-interacting protein ZapD
LKMGKAVYCDDCCLDEADIEQLLDRLMKKLDRVDVNAKWFLKLDISPVIELLRKLGIPSDLIQELERWERLPAPTEEKLKAWVGGEPIRA